MDQDARVCIIELKNQEVDEDALPQALGYAIWAETNPDSIKAIWLESKQKPEDIEIDWDNLDIRVILIAPSFKGTVPRMAGKLGYPIDLVQVRRYCFEAEEFLIVEVLEDRQVSKVSTTKVMEDWDWDYYVSEHGREATAQFRKAVEAADAFVEEQGWGLSRELKEKYVGFKLGNRLVVVVKWSGTHSWNLGLKLPQGVADGFQGQQWELQKYDTSLKKAMFRSLQPDSPDITELESLFVKAYRHISGSR